MAQDALSQILNSIKMRGTIYFHAHFTPPWSVQVPVFRNVARFHMAIRGHCWVRIAGHPHPIKLEAGDLIVIPHGAEHILSDEPERAPATLDEVIARTGYTGSGALAYGGTGEGQTSEIFCGHFEFDEGVVHPMLTALPNNIHIPNTETANAAWLDPVMRFVTGEILGGRTGSDAIAHRLTEIIFIQVVRSFVDRAGDAAGSLAGVLDVQLGKALSAVHAAPEKAWTVEKMARAAGMSRTVFAERFTRLIGLSPLGYLTQWRMHVARRQLIESDRALSDIAEAAGYQSDTAFARAFKRQFGLSPGQLRRKAS